MMTLLLTLHLAMPPVPRIIWPDEPATEATLDDPTALAERIAATSKQAGEKLAKHDAAAGTQRDQKQVSDDLDALIRLLEPPPSTSPSSGGGSKSKDGKEPPPSKDAPPPPKDEPPPPPMGGEPKPMEGQSKTENAPMPKSASPAAATPGQVGGSPRTLQPFEESLARDFWGHLPDAPRQQMMQFYREHYMAKYKDLLADYYQNLAEKEKK